VNTQIAPADRSNTTTTAVVEEKLGGLKSQNLEAVSIRIPN
jgi:hypothetical protein